MESTVAKKTFQTSAERPNEADRMKDRSEAVALNKEIAQHASRKQLTEAMTLFEKAATLGWANSHTYAAAINANIRCGSVSGAAVLFERLRKTRGLKIDVITCTTMMKGFCSDGDIARSVLLFEEMDKCRPPVLPNIRTINTFLRGCVNTGDIENADKMLVKTQKEYLLAPDVSTWEYFVTLLCQGLMLDKAAPIVGRLQNDATMAADLGGMHVVIAKVASLSGAWKTCRKAMEHAKAAIDLNEKQDDLEDSNALQSYNDKAKTIGGKNVTGEVESSESFVKSEKEATGGKRAWKTPGTEEGADSRAQSLEVFRKHKREELRQELVIVGAFMDKMIVLNEKKVNEREKAKKLAAKKEWLSSGGAAGKGLKKSENEGVVGVDGEKSATTAVTADVHEAVVKVTTASAPESMCAVEVGKGSKKRKSKGNSGGGSAAPEASSAGAAEDSKLLYLLPYYSRLFSFAMPQNHVKKAIIVNTDPSKVDVNDDIAAETDPKKLIVNELSQALLTKFGLNVCLEKLYLGPNPEAEEYTAKKLKTEAAASSEKKMTEKIKSGSKDKNLTKKEKRKEKNQEMKMKKKKLALLLEEKKNEIKEATPNEMKFKNLLASNILGDGFINFDKVFERKAFITPEVEAEADVASGGGNAVAVVSEGKINAEKSVEEAQGEVRVRKLEICSGAGEWAITQAASDPLCDWMTMELRHDRVYQTFTRAIFAGVDNVCVMGGDATLILPQRILSDSLDFVFINHPEPPQQTGGFDSQGKHLLTLDFFGELARIVKPSGVVTIVTDNLWYGKYLMRLLASQSHPEFLSSLSPKALKERSKKTESSSSLPTKDTGDKNPKDTKNGKKQDGKAGDKKESEKGKGKGKDNGKGKGKDVEKAAAVDRGVGAPGEWSVLEEEGGFSLYQGKPGCECGVVVDASSYFDRLWKIEQKVERYFLVLEKGPIPYSSEIHGTGLKFVTEKSKVRQELRINTSSNLEERAKKGGYAEKSLKAAAFLQAGGSNKKIKFED